MKNKILYTAIWMLFHLSAAAQSSLNNFELRMENGQMTSSTVYQFDVYLYNTSVSSFELRAGTISFWINPSWRNSGTISVSVLSSELVAAQQAGTASYTNGSTDFYRRTIPNVSAGSGTSISSGSRKKVFTIQLSNSTSFSTSATPNFAWKFSGGNAAGFTFTDTTTTASAIAVNATSVVATQTNCHTPVYWTGSQWNAGSVSAGAASTGSPTSSKDAVIYTGTFTGAINCRNYHLLSGSTHTLGSSTLNVGYNFQNNGTFNGANGTINLTGTQITQTSNQTVGGTAITIANLGFGAASNGGTKTLSCGVSVSGAVTQTGTSILTTGGNLTLLSTATGSARIGQLASGSDISGNIVVERYLPASFRRFRFLSSPVVGATTLQWRDNGASSTGRGIHITGNSGTVDPSTSNSPSAFKYTENLALGGTDLNSKWEAIDGNTALNSGQGYRVFVRGDRTKSLTTASDSIPNNTTIWVSGTYPVSPVNINVTYNPTLGNGWNLVGNPFPSPIDWDAASGWIKTNIGNTIYIWNPLTNTYGSYDGTTSTNSVSRYIGSGQAFFIQATDVSPQLSVAEAAKTNNTSSDLFKGIEPNSLRMLLIKDTGERDEAVIRFMENSSDSFVKREEVIKLMNPSVNLGSVFPDGKIALVNYLSNNSKKNHTVPLMVSTSLPGNYSLRFSQIEQFDSDVYIFLKDNLANTTIDLRKNSTYTFTIDGSPASVANGRMEIIFSGTATGGNDLNQQGTQNQLYVFPNPAKDFLYLSFNQLLTSSANIVIYNATGSRVIELFDIKQLEKVDISNLAEGSYFIEVFTDDINTKYVKRFIK